MIGESRIVSFQQVGVLYKFPRTLDVFINEKIEDAVYFELSKCNRKLLVHNKVYNPFLGAEVLWAVTYHCLNVARDNAVHDWAGRQFDSIHCLGGSYDSEVLNYAFSRVRSQMDHTHGT